MDDDKNPFAGISLDNLPKVSLGSDPIPQPEEKSFFQKFMDTIKREGGSQIDTPQTGSIVAVPDIGSGVSSKLDLSGIEFEKDTGTPTPTPEAPVDDTANVPSDDAGGGGGSGTYIGLRNSLSDLSTKLQDLSTALSSFSEGPVSSSDDVEAAASNMREALESELDDAQSLVPDKDEAIERAKLLQEELRADEERERAILEARRDRELSGIESRFKVLEDDLRFKQRRETGATSTGLARAGGYLGFTGSGQAVMTNLEVVHNQEIGRLAAAKEQAVNAALRAFEEADFKLVNRIIEGITELNDQIDERIDTHFNQMLQATDSARKNIQSQLNVTEFERGVSLENLDVMIESDVIPSTEEIGRIASELGISQDVVRSAIKAKQNTRQLEDLITVNKEQREINEDQRSTYRLVKDFPKGKFFTINGVTYEGQNTTKATGGDKILDYQTVFKDFNNNPWAQAFVGVSSINDVYAFFSSEIPNARFTEAMKSISPDISEAEIQAQWENERRDALGLNIRTDILQLFPSESDRQIILRQAQFERDSQLTEEERAAERTLGFEDLESIPEGRLNQLLEQGREREAAEKNEATGGFTLESLFNQ